MRKASRARLTDATRRASRLQRDHKEPRVFGVGDAIGEERDVVRVCPHERGDLLLVRELAREPRYQRRDGLNLLSLWLPRRPGGALAHAAESVTEDTDNRHES